MRTANGDVPAVNDTTDISAELREHDVIIDEAGNYLVEGVDATNSIIVETGDVNLTIKDVTINAADEPAISVNIGTTLNLEVSGDNVLTGAAGFAGVFVEPAYDSNWNFDGNIRVMGMDIQDVINTDKPLSTPFAELHGNWATLYPSPISVKYEWVGDVKPSDVKLPEAEFLVKGKQYYAKGQQVTGEDLIFDGWYTDPECTVPFVDGTKLDGSITLYGRWKAIEKATQKQEVSNSSVEVSNPQTGDNIRLWLTLFKISMLGFVSCIFVLKEKTS